MRVHYLQHVPFEGPGSILPWLETAGHSVAGSHLYAADRLPEEDDFDLLVVMGGPMSVKDEEQYPWLVNEKRLVRRAVEGGKAVLGICLGAQLIASAMGARIYPNRQREIGWFPVFGLPEGPGHTFHFPPAMDVFHWHGETFDLPTGAVHLARSEACDKQAFQLGPSVIGLQFHLETTPQSARLLVENCRDELVAAPFVQSEEQILAAPPATYRSINGLMAELLSYLLPGSTPRK